VGVARVQAHNADVSRRLITRGVLLGIFFGIWNLLSSLIAPLAEDTIPALLTFYGPMFTAWGVTGFFATRRTRRVVDGIRAATIVAFVTFVVFDLLVILRVNLFLPTLTGRLDWQNMMMRFHASRSESLRTFINIQYAAGAPFKILVATMIGACAGLLGALLCVLAPLGRNTRSNPSS
jgi:hypothetical protein